MENHVEAHMYNNGCHETQKKDPVQSAIERECPGGNGVHGVQRKNSAFFQLKPLKF